MARVYTGERTFLHPILAPVERVFYRAAGVDPDSEMSWQVYALAVLVFNLLGLVAVYVLQRGQGFLPLNPQGFGAVSADSSFNTAVSFATNTNWQGYGGESTMSYPTQMLALTVQNFVSAATGMAVLVALARGFMRRSARTIGNFWVDLTRGTLYVLLPLAFVLSLLLVSQGVVQTFGPYPAATLVQPSVDAMDKLSRSRGWPSARPRRRSRSSSWAPTAAASSTPTRRIRSRTPRRSPTSWKCWRSC